ncbi:MAG: sensor domain-containing diguanylate cyclase [Desulfobulbaceae bacterium]|nr:sensor domain-containing diguanylate cyclase [Desulfobulbaceae bacterium]
MKNDILQNIYYCMERVIIFDGLEDVLSHIVKTACSLTRSDACTMRLFNMETGKLDIRAGVGVSKQFQQRPPLSLGEGLIGKVVRDGEFFRTNNLAGETGSCITDSAELEGINSMLSVPLKEAEDAIGSLTLYRRSSEAFSDHEILLVTIFASQAIEAVIKTRALEALKRQAILDSVTEIHNRHFFCQCFEEELKRSIRYSHPFSLIFIDLDNFKQFNDTHGHLLGDKLLKDFAGSVREQLRENDIFCRYGGEEFVIILPETAKKGGVRLAEKLLDTVKTRHFLGRDDSLQKITFSAGVASFPEDGQIQEELVHKADLAMYEAKRLGKATIKAFHQQEN